MAAEGNFVKLESNGAERLKHAFSVKYIGCIEVATPFHEIKALDETRIALCKGCASLIAQSAGKIPERSINSEIETLIGDNVPKFFNKEIELAITNKFIRLSNVNDKKVFKKVEISNCSYTVTVKDILPNGFVFIGKVKTKTNILQRFCFLLQSPEDPENIYIDLKIAFSKSSKNDNNNQNFDASIAKENMILEMPSPNEYDVLVRYTGNKTEDKTTAFNKSNNGSNSKVHEVKLHHNNLPKTTNNVHKISNDERMLLNHEEQSVISSNFTQGNLYQNSPTSNIFEDNSVASLFAPVNARCFKTTCTEERFKHICKDIKKLQNFFGDISRDETEQRIKNDGEYLIRYSKSRSLTVILSVRQGSAIHHISLNDENGNIASGNFISIYDLMVYHTERNLPFIIEGENPIEVYLKPSL